MHLAITGSVIVLCLYRYLIQTIQYFPKPVIATINKPAEGLGAQLVALCDMVCDKVWLHLVLLKNK